jgi:hypothetical protein
MQRMDNFVPSLKKKHVKKESSEQLLLQGLESILVAWIQNAITGILSTGQP